MDNILDNKFVSTGITLMIGLYASLLGPQLPAFVKNLFNNTIFRILVLFLVLVRANKDPAMAIVIVIAFVLTMDYIYRMDSKEAFEIIITSGDQSNQQSNEQYNQLQNLQTLGQPIEIIPISFKKPKFGQ